MATLSKFLLSSSARGLRGGPTLGLGRQSGGGNATRQVSRSDKGSAREGWEGGGVAYVTRPRTSDCRSSLTLLCLTSHSSAIMLGTLFHSFIFVVLIVVVNCFCFVFLVCFDG